MSLIETILVMAIIATTLAGVSTIMQHYRRGAAKVADKLAALDLQRSLSGLLGNGGVCDYMLGTIPAVVIDPMNISPNPIPPFAQIPSRAVAAAEPAVLADGVTPASPLSSRVIANSIVINNLRCTVLPCAADTNEFTATLQVSFDPTRTVEPIAPLQFPVTLTSTGPPNSQTLTNCIASSAGLSGGGGGGGGSVINRIVVNSPTQSCGGLQTLCPAVPADVQAVCPAGYQVTGCGYSTSYNPTPNDGSGQPWDLFHTNGPDDVCIMNQGPTVSCQFSDGNGNGCQLHAGGAPGCGVCFTAQAICLQIQ